MKPTTLIALDKFIQAKKLEKEAILSLLPDHVGKHLEVIHSELKEMFIEIVSDIVLKNDHSKSTDTEKKSDESVKKVDID